MIKIQRLSSNSRTGRYGGIDPKSYSLQRAAGPGMATTAREIDGLVDMPVFEEVDIVFDETSA
jgi:acetaldehyde dehydrogenase